jgi:UPF0755 protein
VGVNRTDFLVLAATVEGRHQLASELGFNFLQTLPDDAALEGYLFPDTYFLPQNPTAHDLIQRMLERFDATVSEDVRVRMANGGYSLHEVITLASIVEREAVLPRERSTIASVYLNRLSAGIKLDADPTVQYALGRAGDWWPRITAEDYVAVDSAWNTYLNVGLPPSPIANPGLESIDAVIAPDDTQYIFFMRDCVANDGSHLFATTQEEHLENFARCAGQ